ncbi:MAG: CARDB domain-containing protein [Patescibacteria group bacterium]
MGVRSKTLVTVLAVGLVVGVATWQTQNKSLFQGQILDQDTEENAVEETETSQALPDLTADLSVIAPASTDGDLSVNVTIANEGAGAVTGEKSFKYTVYLNDVEVFSNTDSYTTMAPEDSFSFTYPISRSVYSYENTGTAKVVVDSDSSIEEEDEDNNEAEVEYSL